MKNYKNFIIIKLILFLYSIFFYFYLLLRFYKKKINISRLFSTRIGHFIIESELYALNKNDNDEDYFYFDPIFPVANNTIAGIIKKKLKIINPKVGLYLIKIDTFFLKIFKKKKFGNVVFTRSDNAFNLSKNDIFLKPSKKQIDYGNSILKEYGLLDKKFVCLVNRDDSYLKKTYAKDYHHHDYRNSSIKNYLSAAEYLSTENIYTLRMGSIVSEKINLKNKYIIDYASNGMRTDFLDVFLSFKCFFWVSGGTGLDSFAPVYRKPILQTNFCPIIPYNLFKSLPQFTIVIFKYYYDEILKKNMTIDEIFQKDAQTIQRSDIYKKKNISIIENTSDEILNGTKEMIKLLNGKYEKNPDLNRLLKKFWNKAGNFKNESEYPVHISQYYLKKNKKLFE